LNKNLALIALVIFAAGCGLETRTYVITKDRVGLTPNGGNGGCVVGKCPPAPPSAETTRKVYVLEITRPVPESEVQKIEQTAINAIADSAESSVTPDAAPANTAPAAPDNSQAAAAPEVVVPVVGDQPAAAPADQNGGNMQAQTYTVQKDDTLQKISKKLFGSYGKWYKIYEANKSRIKNPNILKPGTVLDVPVVK
jgi:nucleoid-associated protein YgaU